MKLIFSFQHMKERGRGGRAFGHTNGYATEARIGVTKKAEPLPVVCSISEVAEMAELLLLACSTVACSRCGAGGTRGSVGL